MYIYIYIFEHDIPMLFNLYFKHITNAIMTITFP